MAQVTPAQRVWAIADALLWHTAMRHGGAGAEYAVCQCANDAKRAPAQRLGPWLGLEWGTSGGGRPILIGCLRIPEPQSRTGWRTETRIFLLDE